MWAFFLRLPLLNDSEVRFQFGWYWCYGRLPLDMTNIEIICCHSVRIGTHRHQQKKCSGYCQWLQQPNHLPFRCFGLAVVLLSFFLLVLHRFGRFDFVSVVLLSVSFGYCRFLYLFFRHHRLLLCVHLFSFIFASILEASSAFSTFYSVHIAHVVHIYSCVWVRERANSRIFAHSRYCCVYEAGACGACNIAYYVCRDIGLMQLVFIQCFT